MSKAADQKPYSGPLNTGHPDVVTSANQAGVAEGVTPLVKASTVSQIRARNASCDCPHCGAEGDGWLVDPRGRETECEECKLLFVIAADATVLITEPSGKTMSKPAPRSRLLLLCQLIISALIMLGMGTYVWMIQIQYDEAAKAIVWKGRIWMPVFYALTVAAAGFSYDCAKSILFLPEATFKKFLAYAGDTLLSSSLIVIALFAGTYLLSFNEAGARFAGQMIYLVGLANVWWAIHSASGALNVAAGGK